MIRRILCALLSIVALLVSAGGALTAIGCCAIDRTRFPEAHAANQRRQARAGLLTLGALTVAVGGAVGALRPGRRERRIT